MRMISLSHLKTFGAILIVSTALAACSPHKKEVAPVAVTQSQQAPKITLENLDARLKVVEERNRRVDARAAARLAR